MSSDNYVHRGMQTFNPIAKHKEVQSSSLKVANAEAQADIWDIHDSHDVLEQEAVAMDTDAV